MVNYFFSMLQAWLGGFSQLLAVCEDVHVLVPWHIHVVLMCNSTDILHILAILRLPSSEGISCCRAKFVLQAELGAAC